MIYGIIAGLLALKAVFDQFMYLTNGDITLPVIIIVVGALITVPLGIGVFLGGRLSDAE